MDNTNQDHMLDVLIERFPEPSRFSALMNYKAWRFSLKVLEREGLDLSRNDSRFNNLVDRVRADRDILQADGWPSNTKTAPTLDDCREYLFYLEAIWQTNALEANTENAPAPSRRSRRL